MIFEISDDAVITVAGIRMSVIVLEESFKSPPEDLLFSVKREMCGDAPVLTFTQYRTREAAVAFFDELEKAKIDAAAALVAEGEGMPPIERPA